MVKNIRGVCQLVCQFDFLIRPPAMHRPINWLSSHSYCSTVAAPSTSSKFCVLGLGLCPLHTSSCAHFLSAASTALAKSSLLQSVGKDSTMDSRSPETDISQSVSQSVSQSNTDRQTDIRQIFALVWCRGRNPPLCTVQSTQLCL